MPTCTPSCYNAATEQKGVRMTDGNDDLMFGLTDEELDKRFREAVRLANEAKIAMGLPLAKYDAKTKRAYFLYADGTREYFNAT